MNKRVFRILVLSAIALFGGFHLFAATTQNVGLDFVTGKTFDLTNDSATVNQGTAAVADFDNGYIELSSTPDHTLTVNANTAWKVQVAGDTVDGSDGWVITAAATTTCPASKAVSSIDWSLDNFGTAGTALTAVGAEANVQTGAATGASGNGGGGTDTTIAIDYRTDLAWETDTVADNAGTGTTCTYDYDSVVYTLSAN
ncbi:hypothetical protein H8D30_01255 [bacterium]|nr:hypothetical protein [bacterium]